MLVNPVNVVIAGWLACVTAEAVPVVFWLPIWFTPGKLISAEPSNPTPPIKRWFVNFSAVSTLEIPDTVPVTVKFPFKCVSAFTFKPCDATIGPANVIFWPLVPASVNPGREVILDCKLFVTVAAEPVVFWLPVRLTPGKAISDVPSNSTPPIKRGFKNFDAVSTFPLTSPINFLFSANTISLAECVLTVSAEKCCTLSSRASMFDWTSPDKPLRYPSLVVPNDWVTLCSSTTSIVVEDMLNFEAPNASTRSNFSSLRTVTGPLTSTNPWK